MYDRPYTCVYAYTCLYSVYMYLMYTLHSYHILIIRIYIYRTEYLEKDGDSGSNSDLKSALDRPTVSPILLYTMYLTHFVLYHTILHTY